MSAERERETVKEKKRLSALFSDASRSVNGYPNAGDIVAVSLERQHCCLFSLVTLCCSGLRTQGLQRTVFIGAEVLPEYSEGSKKQEMVT